MLDARRHRLIATGVAVVVLALGPAGLAAARPARPPAPRDPVLLVHGFTGSPSNWDVLRARLRAAGYRDREVEAISYDSDETIPQIAGEVRAAADALLARTGKQRLDVVSHSMGALSTRYYVEELGGARKVDAWVSLAGANDGTYVAYACLAYRSCADMEPGSAVLTRLDRDLRSDGRVRFGAWWSPCDVIIVPTSSARLAGARNTETGCLDHAGVLTDPTVLAQVQRFIALPHRPG